MPDVIHSWAITAVKTSAYVAVLGEMVRANPTGGAFAVTMPTVSSTHAGRQVAVHNQSASTNAITVTPDSGHTINGAATLSMTTARRTIFLVYDGVSDWMVL